jgi:hypothetical protein
MIKFIKIFFLLIFTSTLAIAQDSLVHKNPFWLNFGIGGSPKYLNVNISYNKALDNLSYQISCNGVIEGILSSYSMTTGNIGIGLANYKQWYISSVYLGPSVSYGESIDKSGNPVYFWGIGSSINAQIYFMPLYKLLPGVGLGIEVFYNLNAIQTKSVDFRNVYSIRIGALLSNIHMP